MLLISPIESPRFNRGRPCTYHFLIQIDVFMSQTQFGREVCQDDIFAAIGQKTKTHEARASAQVENCGVFEDWQVLPIEKVRS